MPCHRSRQWLAAGAFVAAAAPAMAAQLGGRVVDEHGAPIEGAAVLAGSLRFQPCCGPEYTFLTDAGGHFAGDVEAGEYVLSASGPPQLGAAQRRLVVSASGTNDVELQLPLAPFVFTPDRPPTAALIGLTTPAPDGVVTVTGAPGAVGGGNFVLATTLGSGDFAWTTAAGDGSFSLVHRAPPGSSLLLQADPLGIATRRLLEEITTPCCEGGAASAPGTILRVPDAAVPGPGRAMSGVSGPCKRGYPSFAFAGRIAPATALPGGTLSLTGTLRAHAPGLSAASMEVDGFLYLLTAAYADGTTGSPNTFLASHVLTTTDIAIERSPHGDRVGAGLGRRTLARVAPGEYADPVSVQVPIPADLPVGFYHPVLNLELAGVECRFGGDVAVALVDRIGRTGEGNLYLPPLRIGSPQPPRLFWSLLTDTLSGGSPGVVAIEDEARYALAPRILTPSPTFVVPRRHEASGMPLSYRLEPFVPLVSLGERGAAPDSPRVPFRFPSGQLQLTVTKPDGSVRQAGPAPFAQTRVRTPVDGRGEVLGVGGASLSGVLQLSTMDPAFEVAFDQDGLHEVRLEGWVEDVAGQRWNGGGTYRVWVADPLALDTATLPGTPLEVGDSLHLGTQILPPLPADVEVRVRFAPASNPQSVRETRRRGRASRFGYFATVDGFFAPTEPGEYRVDLVASYRDGSGRPRMGARTWGGVVASRTTQLIAHGRRCTDICQLGPQWFDRTQIGWMHDHLFFPFHRGDIAWQAGTDAARLAVTVQDPSGDVATLLAGRVGSPVPPDYAARTAAGEIPLVSSRPGGAEPNLDPRRVDLWSYSYRSAQRPLVRVREMVAEDGLNSEYWRFNEQYNAQAGVGERGDLPNDFKLLFGGAVLRGAALAAPEYAVYGSLWIHLPADDPIERSRVFPPFQGNGGGPSGGPLMTLRGRAVDLFWHPTAVRPGSILEIGDRVSFAGYFGPTLPCRLELTVTSPSGAVRNLAARANKVGYSYDPTLDFYADEPGRWKVAVRGTFDGVTSAGQVSAPFPTGDVLGTANGEFSFYVVHRDAPPLGVDKSEDSFIRPAQGAVPFALTNPPGATQIKVHSTTTMPGFVLEQGQLPGLTYSYDAPGLAPDFPNLDLFDAEGKAGADAVTMSFMAVAKDGAGADLFRARNLLLQGEELFAPPQEPEWPCVPGDTTLCLNQGRFEVTGTWRDFEGRPGVAHTVALTSETGYLWFFSPGNVEVLIKALDACGFNDRLWVFVAGLTSVETEIRVRDTLTGNVQVYTNPSGTALQPILDTAAFPTCGAPPAPSPLALVATTASPPTSSPSSTCAPGLTALCLADGRFRVTARWRTGDGKTGDGFASPLTADTGTFWFFGPTNLEVVLKVLDACAFPGAPRFWVFAAGVTDVEVTLTVHDTVTGQVKTYKNPLGKPFEPIQDTSAFTTCP